MPVNIPKSQQFLRTIADIKSAAFGNDRAAMDYLQLKRDYDNLLAGVTQLIDLINSGEFSPASGTGSPEGVTAANYSQFYVDTATNNIYYNPTFGADTGWLLTT